VKSFNYVSISNLDISDEEFEDIAMFRGRMFEYTPTDIQKRLEGLDTAALDFMKTLPTFLCSEINQRGRSFSMFIRYGEVSAIKFGGNNVSMTFRKVIDFGEVTFDNKEAPQLIFGVAPFQLYRTHWAVREGDAAEVLGRLSKFNSEFPALISNNVTVPNVVTEIQPPPRDKKILGVADSVESFLQLLYSTTTMRDT
jgi:hypothetical protein